MNMICKHNSVANVDPPSSFFISGSFINIKSDNKKSPQMVSQILPDKCFVFILYDKQKKKRMELAACSTIWSESIHSLLGWLPWENIRYMCS